MTWTNERTVKPAFQPVQRLQESIKLEASAVRQTPADKIIEVYEVSTRRA
jgi:hypothetical protein